TCIVVLLTSLIAGAFPALQASKTDVNEALKAQSGTGSKRGQARRALPALMITELAPALVPPVGAGLMGQSFFRCMSGPQGLDTDGVLTLFILPNIAKYPAFSPQRAAYFQEVIDRVRRLPGIQSASLGGLPLGGPTGRMNLQIEGRPPYEPGKAPLIY